MANKYFDFEEAMDAIKDLLEANMPAEITLINTEKADVYVLTNPVAYHFGLRYVDPQAAKGNCILIIQRGNTDGINFNPQVTEEDSIIEVVVSYWDVKAETVERKLGRYTKAARKIMDTNPLDQLLAPHPCNIKFSQVSSVESSMMDFEGDVYMKGMIIRLRFRDVYTY